MSLTRFFQEPFFTLDEFDQLFDDAFNARQQGGGRVQRRGNRETSLRPRLDLHVDDKSNAVTATFELPGLKKEDVNIEVVNGVLTVSGESKQESSREESGYSVRERSFGKFSRSLQLPKGVKDTDVKASLEHGILTVIFPKTSAEEAPKRITVESKL
ncbi:hypothetical protein QCA50_019890 [Cerrena zonata]|uniref:Uncharacterized protein n=1 Tax=Cerrena zonata TaxID=2478898 RepID=A0AAW0FAG3_9APHY